MNSTASSARSSTVAGKTGSTETLEGPGSTTPGLSSTESPETRPAVVKGRIGERERVLRELPPEGQVARYVLTSAQNNTHVHEDVWLNVMAIAGHYGAELLVGTFSYNKSAYGEKAVKRGTKDFNADVDELWYDPQLTEFICDDTMQLAPGLVWAGELNIIPTASDPLSNLESYHGRASCIVPHAQHAMASVASLDGEAAKLNYTTGTVTQRNYIQKKTGLKAERYHGYGAVLVEVDSEGNWFVRQLEAAVDGSIRDLGLKARNGRVTEGNPVECLVPGDVHVRVVDPTVREVIWGAGGMLDALHPRHQVLHDVIDFRSRNHHEAKDPLELYRKWKAGAESVRDEVDECVRFIIDDATRPWLSTHIAPSNHHEAMLRWLKESDWQKDPVNAVFYHEAWIALLKDREQDIFEWACKSRIRHEADFLRFAHTRFLREDESFVIAKEADGGIEVGMHGHLGPNGSRGNARAFARLGRRVTVGHMHTACIMLGVYVAGTSTKMRIGYNRGPSSWSHSVVLHYPEGTRTMVTIWNGKWRA